MNNSILKPPNQKHAFKSKEFILAVLVVLATFVTQFTGINIESSLLDYIADIDWEKWDTAMLATLFGVLRYFFTQNKITGLFKSKSDNLLE